jgi:hypothetical protein
MRSGTTITGQLLAASPSTVLVGELRPVLLEPERHAECDCGQPSSTCPFWTQVYGSEDPLAVAAATRRAFSLTTGLRIAVAKLLGRDLPANVRRTVEFLRAVRRAAGEQIVVDTSKTPMGVLLWRLAGERVHVVHCVRGMWQVAQAQARPTSQTGLIREPIPKSIVVWTVFNVLTYLSRPLASSYRLITFGRLRREPRRTAEPVWRAAGAQASADAGPTFRYEQSHVLAGNPRRERGRSVTISA